MRYARSPNARPRWPGDITIRTSLLEHRLLAGSRALYQRFRRSFEATIDVRAFYEAKALEQQQRHLRYQDTAYNLEPNVKESPGGLRDLQTIVWIARAAGLGRSWRELAARGLMTGPEAREVARQERLLVRSAHPPALSCRSPRGSAGLRRPDRAGARLRAGRHCRAARVRTADAALLPRRQVDSPDQRHPAAEPACAAVPGRARSAADRRRFSGRRRAARRRRRAAVRTPAGGDLRQLSHAAAASGAQGHVGAHVARAVAQPQSRRCRVSPRSGQPRALHARSSASRAASRTSCGG